MSDQEFVLNGLSDMPTSKSDCKYKLQFNRVPKSITRDSTNDEQKMSSERFYILLTKDGLKVVRSGVRADIIDCVRGRTLNMSEIVQATKSPRSTVVSNVSKMLDEGLIAISDEDGNTNRYRIGCDIILDNYRAEASPLSFTHGFTDHGFFDGGYRYVCSRLASLGFDPTSMMYQCGRMFSRCIRNLEDIGQSSDIATRIGAILHSSDEKMRLMTIKSADGNEMDRYKASFICGSSIELSDPGTNISPSFIGDTVDGSVTI
jgi:DNA-binding transcriptional ArsR family regulator